MTWLQILAQATIFATFIYWSIHCYSSLFQWQTYKRWVGKIGEMIGKIEEKMGRIGEMIKEIQNLIVSEMKETRNLIVTEQMENRKLMEKMESNMIKDGKQYDEDGKQYNEDFR